MRSKPVGMSIPSSSSPADDHQNGSPSSPDRVPGGDNEHRGELELDRLYSGDCLDLFPRVASGSIDLIFADPPFNIGYDYDIYDDRREAESYLDWTKA
jgi:16S rRNA G966 N2-methylase RsmD